MPFLNEALQKGKNHTWNAKWIHPGFIDPTGIHYFWFYKTFTVETIPDKAVINITADRKYKLFVDDRFIGRGPLYGAPDYYSFDTYDIKPVLKAGENTIWVLVMQEHPGDYYAGEHPLAMLAQVELDFGDGTKRVIATDEDWRFFKDNGWHCHTLRSFYDLDNMEAIEVFDARNSTNPKNLKVSGVEPQRAQLFNRNTWIREMYEDSPVMHLGKMWRYLLLRDIPYMLEHETEAVAVVRVGEVEPGNVDKHSYKPVAQMWQGLENMTEAKVSIIRDVENVISQNDSFAVLQPATQSEYPFRSVYPALILDFGAVMNGYVQIDLEAPAGMIIDIAYAHVLDDGKVYYKTGHHYRNKRYITQEGRQQWESFEFVNARYLQVTVRAQTPPVFKIQQFEPVKIFHIGLKRTEYPIEHCASFCCSSELLEKLVAASDNTALTCINDKIVDNYYREKNNWSGDITTVMPPLIYMHGNLAILKRYFRTFCYEQNPWGTFNIMVPEGGDLLFDHSFGIILRLEEYCTLTGDTALAAELYPHIRRFLEMAEKYENSDGVIEAVPWVIWFDWANLNRKGIHSTLCLMYLGVLIGALRLARWAGAENDRAVISEKIDHLRKSCVQYFWNDEEGCMAEYVENGTQSKTICEHSNALAILTDCLEPKARERMIERIFGRGMALDDNMSVIKVSPSFQYYAMLALARAGREDLLLEFFDKRSGLFIRRGLDTIPEVWDVDARTHDSFAQATAPESKMILSEIAGLKPFDCGFAHFVAEPRFDLIDRVSAKMPTNVGEIGIEWRTEDGTVVAIITKPENTVCTLKTPDGWVVTDVKTNGSWENCKTEFSGGTEAVLTLEKL